MRFSYPSRPELPVLQKLSFVITRGGPRVALCGPSGGGKSTVCYGMMLNRQ